MSNIFYLREGKSSGLYLKCWHMRYILVDLPGQLICRILGFRWKNHYKSAHLDVLQKRLIIYMEETC